MLSSPEASLTEVLSNILENINMYFCQLVGSRHKTVLNYVLESLLAKVLHVKNI